MYNPPLPISSITYRYIPTSISHEQKKYMLEKNKFTGLQVALLPYMSSVMLKQEKETITLTTDKMDQCIPKLTMDIYLQYQQKK